MPKMKTNRAAYKRFKKTGSGKLRRMRAFKSHILTKKTTKRKRTLRQDAEVHPSDVKRVMKMLPYGAKG